MRGSLIGSFPAADGKEDADGKKEDIAECGGKLPILLCQQGANSSAEDKKQYNAVIISGFFAFRDIFALRKAENQFCPAAKVAGTHRCCIGQAMDFAETLRL